MGKVGCVTVSMKTLSLEMRQGIRRLIQKKSQVQHVLDIRETTAAGLGVFNSNQCILPHTLLTLYPGPYVPAPPHVSLSVSDEGESILLVQPPVDPSYLMYSDYGGYFDAKEASLTAASFGHLINHSSGTCPNVDVLHFKWKEVLSSSLHQAWEEDVMICNYLPPADVDWYFDSHANTTVQFPSPDQSEYWWLLNGVAIVSISPIRKDEELLLDYQLALNEETPSWYRPAVYG